MEKKRHRADYFRMYNAEQRPTASLRLAPGMRERWRAAAEAKGMTLNAFVIECVEKAIENE